DCLDLAAVRAATGEEALALSALEQAFAVGFKDAAVVQATLEFARLRPREEFQALLERMKELSRTLAWTTDFAAAKARAAREKKDLFLYFNGRDWAPSGVVFQKDMLSGDPVVDYLSRHFVAVELARPMFGPPPKNYATTLELHRKWQINNFATMVLADAEGRAYWKTDKGSSEAASWEDTQDF